MIKVGQFLSARLDVLPPEITDELAGLQDEVPAEAFEAIRAQAEAELGHAALRALRVVRRDAAGRRLARPGAPRAAARGRRRRRRASPTSSSRSSAPTSSRWSRSTSRRCAAWAAGCSATSRSATRADVRALVEEFAATTREEIDYLAEGSNAETFAANFADDPRVHVPQVVWEPHHAPRAHARGRLRDQAQRLRRHHRRRASTASQVAAGAVRHLPAADLRGRLLPRRPAPRQPVRHAAGGHRRGRQPRLAADVRRLRHGRARARQPARRVCARCSSPSARRTRARLVAQLQDARRAAAQRRPQADRAGEHAGVRALLGHEHERPARHRPRRDDAASACSSASCMLDLPFQLPENLLLLGRTVAILSGMCTGLDPEFNLWTSIAPYAEQAHLRRGRRRGRRCSPRRRRSSRWRSACRAAPTAC